jgi:hypothetical protein
MAFKPLLNNLQNIVSIFASNGSSLGVMQSQRQNAPGQSPEEAARKARYAALSEAVHTHPDLQGVKDVALAQHADDQLKLCCWPSRAERDCQAWPACLHSGCAMVCSGTALR